MPRHTAGERRKRSSLGSIPRAGSKPKAPRANIGGRTPIPRAKTKGRQTRTAVQAQSAALKRKRSTSTINPIRRAKQSSATKNPVRAITRRRKRR